MRYQTAAGERIIETIRGRLDAATYGPWQIDHAESDKGEWLYADINHDAALPDGQTWNEHLGVIQSTKSDAEFIGHAAEDMSFVLAAVQAALTVHSPDPSVRKRVEWCADCNDIWPCSTVEAIYRALEGHR